jgi:hypothetical protein
MRLLAVHFDHGRVQPVGDCLPGSAGVRGQDDCCESKEAGVHARQSAAAVLQPGYGPVSTDEAVRRIGGRAGGEANKATQEPELIPHSAVQSIRD